MWCKYDGECLSVDVVCIMLEVMMVDVEVSVEVEIKRAITSWCVVARVVAREVVCELIVGSDFDVVMMKYCDVLDLLLCVCV